MHHREHPHGLHHCLVRQLYCLRPQGPEESGEDSGVHHRQQTSRPAGHLPVLLPEENPEDPVGLQPHGLFTLLPSGRRKDCRDGGGLPTQSSPPFPPLHINNTAVSMVESLKFLGTTISRDL
ncbi:hypothetical protein NFI96_008858, partial [Prochilodus magdalenae]